MTTALLAGKAAYKQGYRTSLDHEYYADKSKTDKLKDFWKLYIPAAAAGAITVSAIVYGNRIGTRRAAAIAAAFTISERAFEEYKAKVVEKLGEKKEQAVRDEIAQDRVTANPASQREVVITDHGSVLCYEAFTGRYFLCDMETLRKAENDINAQVIHDGYAQLSDFYAQIGLPQTSQSDEVGWNTDKLLKLQFSAVIGESNKPCIVVDYEVNPIRHYNRLK